MKALFASETFGLLGLVLFFTLFIGLLIWIFRPGAKAQFQQHSEIPLKDDDHE